MHEIKTRDQTTNDQQFSAFANGRGSMALYKFKKGSYSHGAKLYCHLFVRWCERGTGNLDAGEPGCSRFLIFREECIFLSAHWQNLTSVPLGKPGRWYSRKFRGRRWLLISWLREVRFLPSFCNESKTTTWQRQHLLWLLGMCVFWLVGKMEREKFCLCFILSLRRWWDLSLHLDANFHDTCRNLSA